MSRYEVNTSGILQIRGGGYSVVGILAVQIDDVHLDIFERFGAHPQLEFHCTLSNYFTGIYKAPSEDIRE